MPNFETNTGVNKPDIFLRPVQVQPDKNPIFPNKLMSIDSAHDDIITSSHSNATQPTAYNIDASQPNTNIKQQDLSSQVLIENQNWSEKSPKHGLFDFVYHNESLDFLKNDQLDQNLQPIVSQNTRPEVPFINSKHSDKIDLNSYFQNQNIGNSSGRNSLPVANTEPGIIEKIETSSNQNSQLGNKNEANKSVEQHQNDQISTITKTELEESPFEMMVIETNKAELEDNEFIKKLDLGQVNSDIQRFVYRYSPEEKKHKKIVEYKDGSSKEVPMNEAIRGLTLFKI